MKLPLGQDQCCLEMIRVALTDAAYDANASTLLRRKMSDDRQFAPATLRNRDFILDVLRDVLPTTGDILEVASGSGEHIVHFCEKFPHSRFPTFRS